MKLEDICVSLDLAKQLKAAGYPQESLFWWNYYSNGKESVFKLEDFEIVGGIMDVESVAAPTSAEIGEKLPKWIYTIKTDKDYYCWSDFEDVLMDELDTDLDCIEPIHADTEVNARAKMWLYLKKEGLL